MFDVDIETLRKSLYSEVPIMFTYFKKDGSKRTAMGTLNEKLIPEEFHPKDSSVNVGTNLKYFDMEKKAWRSLSYDCSTVQMME